MTLRPAPKPAKPASDPAYLAEVRRLPCIVCGGSPCDPHHPIEGRHSGSRVDDRDAYPLCRVHHDYRHAEPAAFKRLWGPEALLSERTRMAVEKLRREMIGGRA